MAATAATLLSIAHQTRFALCLAAAFSSPSSPPAVRRSNAVFSPLSLHVALSLLAASSGGATRDQLLASLGGGHGPGAADSLHPLAEQVARFVMADGSEAGGPRIAFADAVFADASWKLKPTFQEVAVGKYKAHTHSVDFQKKTAEVLGQVNTWVEKVTSGTIKELLPPGSVDESTRLVLGNALYFKGLGLQLPFSPEADLSEFVDSPVPLKLSVSSILHKSSVEVNEEGTEAAAASAIVMRGASLRRRSTTDDFIADHPFLFLIREDTTGVVMFVGHVVNPLLS